VNGDRHVPRDVALQAEHVAQVAFVAVRPQVAVAPGVDELNRDAHAVAGTQDRPFDRRVNPQFACDLRQRFRRPSIAHRRRSRDHVQCRDSSQVRDQEVGEPVREVVLLRITIQIDEWQDDERARGLALCARDRRRGPRRRNGLHGSDESVAEARHGLEVSRLGCTIAERLRTSTMHRPSAPSLTATSPHT
jgi:hypothetical protein